MPIYEYYCSQCRDTFSALRPMSQADATIPCANCDSRTTRRVLSLFAVQIGSDGMRASAGSGSCACGGAGCGCN
jgi:putative FmdB family regulatory protein